MNRFITLFAITLALLLTGCASYKPVPDGYTGPIASLKDSSIADTGSRGRLFFAESIDGNEMQNAERATRGATYGRGFSLYTRTAFRDVPIRPMKVRLVAKTVVAAPIHEIGLRMIGEFFSIEGDVDFLPVAGAGYTVMGILTKEKKGVWIQDDATGEPVTKIIGDR
jgi:hypothetical protein